MIRELLREMGGIGVYGILSMLLFFTIFTVATVWAVFLRKPYIRHMSNLPLESDDPIGEHHHE